MMASARHFAAAASLFFLVVDLSSAEVLETALFKGSFLLASSVVDSNGTEFLSADEAGRDFVGIVAKDYGSGRQRWNFLFGGPDWYHIVASVGTTTSFDYLGFDLVKRSIRMYVSDDGSGQQRWQLVRSNTSDNIRYIRPYNHSGMWLSLEGAGNSSRSVSLSRSPGLETQWTLLEFAGEYNLINGASYLGASTQTGRGVPHVFVADDSSGLQRWQLLKQPDGLYRMLLDGGGVSELKYLATPKGNSTSNQTLLLDSRNGSIHWIVSANKDGTFTIQSPQHDLWLTMPQPKGSAAFLASTFINDGSMRWALNPTDQKPVGNQCISSVDSDLYLRSPGILTWNLARGPAADWYHIIAVGSKSPLYLSAPVIGDSVSLVAQDDGTGKQRWVINHGGNGRYVIQPWAPDGTNARYLSVFSNSTNSVVSLSVMPHPMHFVIGQCPQTTGTNTDKDGMVVGIILAFFGIGAGLGVLAYGYYRNQKKQVRELPIVSAPRDFLADHKNVTVGKPLDDFEDVKVELKDSVPELGQSDATKPQQSKWCWSLSKLMPCHSFAFATSQ